MNKETTLIFAIRLKVFKKLILSIQYFFLILVVSAQSFDDLSKNFLHKAGLSDTNFEQSIAELKFDHLIPNDTIIDYRQWLADNKQTILLNSSDNFKAHYFLELAQCNIALKNNSISYQNIDSAIFYINPLKYPKAYFGILYLGASVSRENMDGTTAIRFLKQIIDSKTIDMDSVSKGEVLARLSGTLENMYRNLESDKYCQQAMDIYLKMEDDTMMVKLLIIMFNNAYNTAEGDSYWEYLYQAEEIAQQSGDSALLADVYTNFGIAHYRNKNHKEAIRYYKMARSLIAKKGSQNELWAATYLQLSYSLLDSVEPAYKISKYLLKHSSKANPALLSNAYLGSAWCFAKHGQDDSATNYLRKSAYVRESVEKAEASPDYYHYMYEVAMLIENYELAINYLHKSLVQFKKYNRKVTSAQLTSVRAQFNYDLQKERIKKLKVEKEYEHEKVQRHRIGLIAIVFILLMAIVFLYLLRKQLGKLKAAYKIVVKKNLELDMVNIGLKKLEKKKANHSNGVKIKNEDKIYINLKSLLEKDKIFRQKDLTESKLSKMLGTNNSYLSSIINKRFRLSFKTLVNKYRIDEARKLLVSKEYTCYSIEGVANEVGFHSRSAFYRIFKQNTGMTPMTYIDIYKQIDD